MRLRKSASMLAAVTVCAAGLVGVGASQAQADTCAISNATYFGATVTLCGSSNGTLTWSINTRGASTDERMWFTLQDYNGFGCVEQWDVNDYQQNWGTVHNPCQGPWTVSWYSTEASRGQTGSDGLTWG